jgi:hypothetical protein
MRENLIKRISTSDMMRRKVDLHRIALLLGLTPREIKMHLS